MTVAHTTLYTSPVSNNAAEADRLVEALLASVRPDGRWRALRAYQSLVEQVAASAPRLQLDVLLAILRRCARWDLQPLVNWLVVQTLPWTAADVEAMLCAARQNLPFDWSPQFLLAEQFRESGGVLTPAIQTAWSEIQTYYAGTNASFSWDSMVRLLNETMNIFPRFRDHWGIVATTEIATLSLEKQDDWKRLFYYACNCHGAKPIPAWRQNGKPLVEAIGAEAFRSSVIRWFHVVAAPTLGDSVYNGSSADNEYNIDLLKGLAWLCADSGEPEIARALAHLIPTLLKGPYGPWGVRAANGAIWALSAMECREAIAQLSRLNLKVASRSARLQIEEGLEAAAKRAGVTKADLEDMSAPTYGFDATGIRSEIFGDVKAVATVGATGEISVEWIGANGKAVKAPPAVVKKSYAAELKAFKAEIAAAATMLTAQKLRFDSFYLPERAWTLQTWRERFATHPLLGNIAHRLIWQFGEKEGQSEGIWSVERQSFVDVGDQPLERLTDATEVRLWHPIGATVDQVVAWRDYLQQHAIIQPFKQAYREVYLLTDAERNTAIYSNRFAAHLLKQHQMHVLAGLRGWRSPLQIMSNDSFPPATKLFPEQGIRAEFWIEGVGENHSTDFTESGTYLSLATDQVRFYSLDAPEDQYNGTGFATIQRGQDVTDAAGMLLSDVPSLVFSEVMRDVDMFVGVCSVGNDPAWRDGGADGHYRDYWTDYSFGDLSASAVTRRDVLKRLLPRLKIAARCTLLEKFLVVRGDLRIYKIHLGSGNILMEPNDQYLCIVQDRRGDQYQDAASFLPFEGDQRLALILSKAFLLAEDTRISDTTITTQIKHN